MTGDTALASAWFVDLQGDNDSPVIKWQSLFQPGFLKTSKSRFVFTLHFHEQEKSFVIRH